MLVSDMFQGLLLDPSAAKLAAGRRGRRQKESSVQPNE